jgi:hypothetical protein
MDYAICYVQGNNEGKKLNENTHRLVYAGNVNSLDEHIRTITNNKEALLVTSKEIVEKPSICACLVKRSQQEKVIPQTEIIDTLTMPRSSGIRERH